MLLSQSLSSLNFRIQNRINQGFKWSPTLPTFEIPDELKKQYSP